VTDPGYPYPPTTAADGGPPPHPALQALLPLLGRWRGTGKGGYPSLPADFDYAQEICFTHDGRPFLSYRSRAWIIDAEGRPVRPGAQEAGWWRPQADGALEVLFSQPTGISELCVGEARDGRYELASDAVLRTATAKEVTATRRLYGLVDGDLAYAMDLAAVGHPLTPHLSARLVRLPAIPGKGRPPGASASPGRPA